jgi:hypothetical protein
MKNLLLIVLGISYLKADEVYPYTIDNASSWLISISLACSEQVTQKLLDQSAGLNDDEYEAWSDNFEVNKESLTKECEFIALNNLLYYLVQTKLEDITNDESIEVQNVNSSNIENFLAAVKKKGEFGGENLVFWEEKLSYLVDLVSGNLSQGIRKNISGNQI